MENKQEGKNEQYQKLEGKQKGNNVDEFKEQRNKK